MFNSFTYVIYITFNLSPNVCCSFFVFCFFVVFFFFHVYSVLNDYIFLEKKKRNSTGQDVERHSWDPGFDRNIVWDSGKFIGIRNWTA